MITFEEIWKLTGPLGHWPTFWEHESGLLYKCLCQLPPNSTLVEIGCEFGRSTSILAQVARDQGHSLTLIDPYINANRENSIKCCADMLKQVGAPYTFHHMRTDEVPLDKLPTSIDLLHVDGGHYRAELWYDLTVVAVRVRSGGFLCCHDYGESSQGDVNACVDEFVALDGWTRFDHVGGLVAWRRA